VSDTFPRQYARTQRFTLGEPRTITVSADGRRIVFLRSRAGDDPVTCLWVLDSATGVERLVADPHELLATVEADLPPEELARRERARESAGGITAYATDAAGTVACFALGGRLFVAGLISARARELAVAGPVFDPRPDPLARRVAYVSGRFLCLGELDGSWRVIAGDPDDPTTVSWGSADFIAAEEMDRLRGYWWSPEGDTLAVCRVDTSPVTRWYIGDPADPAKEPATIAYPVAGTANADVALYLVGVDAAADAAPLPVEWDRSTFPYLADVSWSAAGLVAVVQGRDQRTLAVLQVDPHSGATTELLRDHDDAWVELVPGSHQLAPDGRLVSCADRDGARRLLVDGEPVTPEDLQVRSIVRVRADDGETEVWFTANPLDDATVAHVWRWRGDGALDAITDEPGVHSASVGGSTVVVRSATLDEPLARTASLDGIELTSHAESPLVRPNVRLLHAGERRLATAVLLPHDHDGSPLPVLLDPYGGPHALRVTSAQSSYFTSQWFADQGFAVVVIDGRGSPGRGSVWERAVHGDLTSALVDQVEGLHQAADELGCFDLERVAIRGWSFGGYLAALAVMRRPDVFHAAVAGAPVTEWRLYDTHYTERYLGDPNERPDVYDANSLIPLAASLTRPLLLIHGLADDNVVAAHTLQLSSALLAAGKPHEVLPLVGVTHMTPQEVVAENLLLHQLEFLERSLGVTRRSTVVGEGGTTS
jgi:dipeptidyl-peptidase-4